MSCRVMSKGVGTIMIHHVLRMAKEAGVRLRAEFVSNDRNRQMLITYRFAGPITQREMDGGLREALREAGWEAGEELAADGQ